MADTLTQIRKEIVSLAEVHHPEVMDKVTYELDIMELIDDIDGKGSVLEKIYRIWKANNTKRGHLNKINSWTAYAIGLTDQKPGLNDEFLPLRRAFARAGFPDIDSDFNDERREEVIDHLVDKYGRECVGNIGTYSQFHLKSVVRQLVKALDIGGGFFKGKDEYKTINRLKGDEIIASLPEPQGAKLIYTDPDSGESHEIKTVKDAYQYVPSFKAYMDKHPDILTHAQYLEGLNNTFSVHASGIVISNHPLRDIAPMRPAKKKKIEREDGTIEQIQSYATQFAADDCETMGLIKFDLLAIKTLAIVQQCLDSIYEKYGISLDIEHLPMSDSRTFSLYRTGNLVGVFQCERYGMQKVCREIGVDRFDDIMAAIALYRPGPMVNIPTYIQRKKGLAKIDYFHPTIEPYVKKYLADTYGVCVYQEQIMQVCMSLAGFSVTDGYVIIKSVGKKKLDLLAKYRKQFVFGCVKNGVPEDVACQYWDKFIIPFSSYGFNRAHSCCYGYNSYLTAYLKANYREEFMCSSLNVESARKKWIKVATLEKDCRSRNNITIGKRDLNCCGLKYVIKQWADPDKEQQATIQPSILCKGLSLAAAIDIVNKRPFTSLRDFATRTGKVVDNSSVEALAEAGFFSRPKDFVDEFKALREDLKKAQRRGLGSGDMFA